MYVRTKTFFVIKNSSKPLLFFNNRKCSKNLPSYSLKINYYFNRNLKFICKYNNERIFGICKKYDMLKAFTESIVKEDEAAELYIDR